jgi:hypothetical protein
MSIVNNVTEDNARIINSPLGGTNTALNKDCHRPAASLAQGFSGVRLADGWLRGKRYFVSPAFLRAVLISANFAPPLSSSLTWISSFSALEALAFTPLTLANAS